MKNVSKVIAGVTMEQVATCCAEDNSGCVWFNPRSGKYELHLTQTDGIEFFAVRKEAVEALKDACGYGNF